MSIYASSSVDIPSHEKMRWAYGEGKGSLGQWFQITGGTGGTGTTDTTLLLDYSGSLYGSAGDDSYFKTEIITDLELWASDSIGKLGKQLIQKVGDQVLAGGPNGTLSQTISLTPLSDTATLSYNTWYS